MKCEEVQKRLKENAEITPEINEHLSGCRSCSLSAESLILIKDMFKAVRKNEAHPASSLLSIQKKVEDESDNYKESIMSKIKNQLNSRPGLIYGMGLALIVFLFITLVPFSYMQTVGYEVKISGIENATRPAIDKYIQAIDALGFDNISIARNESGIRISTLPDRVSARKVAAAFNLLVDKNADISIEPVVEKVSGSLYAQVVNKYKIEVDAEGKTDEEISADIRQQLLDAGFTDADVTVTSDGETRKVDVSVSKSDDETEGKQELQLMIVDGDDISFEVPEEMPQIEIETEGKSDEEIITEVKEKLAQQGMPDANVNVITREDGKREILVSVEKEETKGN